MNNILIIGANSDIARACIKQWSSKYNINTISRDELDSLDIKLNSLVCNYDLDTIDHVISPFVKKIDNLRIILICFGTLTNNDDFLTDRIYFEKTLDINLTSKIYLINVLNKICNNTSIGVINSVAGTIARGSNFSYGMHKSALSFYLRGLNLNQSLNRYVDIKPGFISTKLTSSFKKNFLWISTEYAARVICRNLEKNKRSFYVPNFWFLVVLILKLLPKSILKKL